jgi:hypothetical protein
MRDVESRISRRMVIGADEAECRHKLDQIDGIARAIIIGDHKA